MVLKHQDGRDAGLVMLYALSTCQWCEKTRMLLAELGVAFDYLYVDLLGPVEFDQVYAKVKEYNPRGSFPTLVVDGRVIVGFMEEEIREVFGGA